MSEDPSIITRQKKCCSVSVVRSSSPNRESRLQHCTGNIMEELISCVLQQLHPMFQHVRYWYVCTMKSYLLRVWPYTVYVVRTVGTYCSSRLLCTAGTYD